MEMTVCCPVFPTEDKQLVETALANLFLIQESEEQETETYIELKTLWNDPSSLSSIRQRIHCFEKQAAFVDKLRVVDDAQENPPLGFIKIALRFQNTSEFENFLDWFAPRVSSGHVADY